MPVQQPSRALFYAWTAILVVAGSLWAIHTGTQPFDQTMAQVQIDLSSLSWEEIQNIQRAANQLNGQYLMPNAIFSFNQAVPQRHARRGYQAAGTYWNQHRVKSVGGGICVLSSAVYQVALKQPLGILHRTPHQRVMQTVPPGLDATVWEMVPGGGGEPVDLVVKNQGHPPLQWRTVVENTTLQVSLQGPGQKHWRPATIRRHTQTGKDGRLCVTVNQQLAGGPQPQQWSRISRDCYGGLPVRGAPKRTTTPQME
ncbi:MAG: VanW family protein [Candidatus Melainabacteria bacterium]|nr:VanW family protein [Candidatus Melainabacteria bacterium]